MKFSLKIFFSTAILIASLTVIASANKKGGDLRYAHLQKAKSLDANVWTATNAAHIMRQIYDPLVWQPEPGKFVPGLATEWKIEKNMLGRLDQVQLDNLALTSLFNEGLGNFVVCVMKNQLAG